MIIKFNPSIFKPAFRDLHPLLSKITLEFLEERFMWDIDNLSEIFPLDDLGNLIETEFINNNFSLNQKNEFRARVLNVYRLASYISSTHRKYISTVVIGMEESEVNPLSAYNIILKEPSIIILENNRDWKFITGVVKKYKTHRTRKEIYKLIEKNLDNSWIRSRQAGGKGEIIHVFEYEKDNIYKDTYKYKIMALFDSDRDSPTYLNHPINLLINYFKDCIINSPQNAFHENSDLIQWHMLYKRELENYVPISLIAQYTDAQPSEIMELQQQNANQLDFLKFEDFFRTNRRVHVKHRFPEIFNEDYTRDILEERCIHHKVSIETPNQITEQVSELEEILLKIAKII